MEKYEQLLISMRRVIRAIDVHSRQLNKESGLTGPQLLVMKKIAQLDGPMAKQVAKEITLSPATITNIIDRLEARELVKRQRSEHDKRKVELYLTQKGQLILDNDPQPLQRHFIERFQSLQGWEQSQILSSVERIATMMDADEIDVIEPLITEAKAKDQP
ncbi:MAG: MarR family transcriptional regulator [Gammaproteobacteria bacterium]|nr:MarR family transcriptional regulator [Gammaproteobacteria bacterium]